MQTTSGSAPSLSPQDIGFFIENGFVRIDEAFSQDNAAAARSILWQALDLSPDDPAGWTQPVIRLGQFAQEPFFRAASSSRLHRARDQLVGPDRWVPPGALGTFPVRFPSDEDPGDTGWHIDVSFGTEQPAFMEWRANVHSRGRCS
jgi:hypothetical protein